MAIYGTLNQVQSDKHYVWESSNMKATLVGNIYDGVCEEDVDNTTPLVLGGYTGDGLQLREVSKVTDPKSKIVVAASVPLIKDAFTREQAEPYHFYNKEQQCSLIIFYMLYPRGKRRPIHINSLVII